MMKSEPGAVAAIGDPAEVPAGMDAAANGMAGRAYLLEQRLTRLVAQSIIPRTGRRLILSGAGLVTKLGVHQPDRHDKLVDIVKRRVAFPIAGRVVADQDLVAMAAQAALGTAVAELRVDRVDVDGLLVS
jgi:hypothetical protein